MFLFIAGVQPRTVTLEKQSHHPCPRCRQYNVRRQRTDHYFSFFFIPLIRVKKGSPFLSCTDCHAAFDTDFDTGATTPERGPDEHACRGCGGRLENHFSFCPHCGQKIK